MEECDDCISRQAAINIVVCDILSSAIVYGRTEEGMAARKAIVDGLKRLPPVTPQPKVGQWVDEGDKNYRCSRCGELSCCKGNYCSDCGAKMGGELE